MNKKVIIIHRILFYTNVLFISASLVFYLIKWNSLPDEIGMHFDPNGNFDVFASKIYGFYPHVVCGLIIGGIAFAQSLIKKKKTGFKITEKGEMLFKAELLLTLDIFLFMWSVMFSLWSYAVAKQVPYKQKLAGKTGDIVFIIICLSIILQIITCRKYREKSVRKEKNLRLEHNISRLIAWLLHIGMTFILFWCWNRFPGDEEKYYDPEYAGLAYFENFDAYLDKRLFLIPFSLAFIILIIFEVVSSKAIKSDKKALSSLISRLEAICGLFFFWWDMMLTTEEKIGIVSVSIFAVLCIISFILYFRNKKAVNSK